MGRKIKKKVEQNIFIVWAENVETAPMIFYDLESLTSFIETAISQDSNFEKVIEESLHIVSVKHFLKMESIVAKEDGTEFTFTKFSPDDIMDMILEEALEEEEDEE
jgi:hypothetical protein